MSDREAVWIASASFLRLSEGALEVLRKSGAVTVLDQRLCLNPNHLFTYEEVLIILGKQP